MSVLLGLLANGSDAESAINNLTEEGVSPHSISLVMADEAEARAIADDAGPLKSTAPADLQSKLAGLGIPQPEVYSRAVQQGQALLVISASGSLQDAVKETLNDYRAQHIAVV